ncbi:MAG TPA: matrixin family metalloprotease [Thermoanaerobaculia bacterium]|nr:matrixin family metalloprotease [Thermoanaerobaculia bacterium]
MNRFRRFRTTAFALVAAGLLASAVPSHAYRMIQQTNTGWQTSSTAVVTCNDAGGFTHWNTRNIIWYHNTANQGSGKATALTNAMTSWNNVASANHVLSYISTATATFGTIDDINVVDWDTGNGCSGGCLALTGLYLLSGQVIVESDITFNNAQTWNTNGSDSDVEAVAAHEFGHSLGIHHTEVNTTPRPTMYQFYFGTDGRSLHSDDESALQCAESTYAPSCGAFNSTCVLNADCCSGKCWIKTLPAKCL